MATTEIFQAVLGGSQQKIQRELKGVWDNGYTNRPKQQWMIHKIYEEGHGRSVTIYSLADKGMSVLQELRGISAPRTSLNSKIKEIGETTIFHDVVLTKIWACLKAGLKEKRERLGGQPYNLVFWYQDRQQRDKLITKLAVKSSDKTLTLIPDAAFKLQCPKSQYLFFVEYYRSAKGGHQNYLDKLKLYNLYYEQKHFKKYDISKGFRVITLVPTRRIMENVINLIIKTKKNEDLRQYRFWFVAEENFRLYKEKAEGKSYYNREPDFESILEPIFRTPQDDKWHCLEE